MEDQLIHFRYIWELVPVALVIRVNLDARRLLIATTYNCCHQRRKNCGKPIFFLRP